MSELCHWEKDKVDRKTTKGEHCPTFRVLWLKNYKLFNSLHGIKHYIKGSFTCKLPSIWVSWMFEKWMQMQCSAAPHPPAFPFKSKIPNGCTSLFSAEQLLVTKASQTSPCVFPCCFQDCRGVPGKTEGFIASHVHTASAHIWSRLTLHHWYFSVLLCHAQLSAGYSNLGHLISFWGFLALNLAPTLWTLTSFEVLDASPWLFSACSQPVKLNIVALPLPCFPSDIPFWIAGYFIAEPLHSAHEPWRSYFFNNTVYSFWRCYW